MSMTESIIQASKRRRMIDGLQELVNLEVETQLATGDPNILEPSPDKMRTFTLAMMVELSEVIQELNWKPWKLEKQVSFPRVIQEEADVMAFFLLHLSYLCRITGGSVGDFVDAFIEKSEVNAKRLRGEVVGYGYDGSLGERPKKCCDGHDLQWSAVHPDHAQCACVRSRHVVSTLWVLEKGKLTYKAGKDLELIHPSYAAV